MKINKAQEVKKANNALLKLQEKTYDKYVETKSYIEYKIKQLKENKGKQK
jgi:hypothetical protein